LLGKSLKLNSLKTKRKFNYINVFKHMNEEIVSKSALDFLDK